MTRTLGLIFAVAFTATLVPQGSTPAEAGKKKPSSGIGIGDLAISGDLELSPGGGTKPLKNPERRGPKAGKKKAKK